MVVATHGRSFWILDDLTPLHQLREAVATEQAFLYAPRPTTRFRMYGRAFLKLPGIVNFKMTGPVTVAYRAEELPTGAIRERFLDAGQNPPDGVIIHYWLRDKPEEEVTLTILDADGNELRSFSSEGDDKPRVSKELGANRFVWDLRTARPTKLDDPGKSGPFAMMADEVAAPRVLQGEYQVRLKVGELELTERVQVLPDPRIPASRTDLRRQFELKSQIRDDISRVHEALNQLRRIRGQVEDWEKRLADDEQRKDVVELAGQVKEALSEVERELINVDADKPQPGAGRLKEKLAALSQMIDESDDAPTRGAVEVQALLGDQVESVQARLRNVIADDVGTLTRMLEETKLPLVGV
jgi:DNA-binding FrmR family transcriptional regulator